MKNRILEIANHNNGYIIREVIKKYNIPSIYLTRLVNEGKLKRIHRGIYLLSDYVEDEFYIYSVIYSKLVYSKETALYLNNLSNRQFTGYYVTFPYGTNIPKIKNYIIEQTRKKTYDLGIEYIETPYGNKVRCYNKERCICDLFINDYDFEDKIFAIIEYKNNYLDFDKLYNYADQLGILDKVKNVFEVIVWN